VMSVEESHPGEHRPELDLFIAPMGEAALRQAAQVARELRRAGLSVELAEEGRLKRSLELANKLGARYTLILGEDELASGKYALKNMATGQQESLAPEQLVERVGHGGKL